MSLLKHDKLHLAPDATRTVIRPFDPQYPQAFADTEPSRTERIVDTILAMDEDQLGSDQEAVIAPLQKRHRALDALLLRRYDEIAAIVPAAKGASDAAKLVIGAYFSEEYSFEAAALFNPSMVIHPDDEDVGDGNVRFLLSLRGIGEGHISSVTFRTGHWTKEAGFSIDPVSNQAVSPRIEDADVAGDGVTRIMCEGSRDPSESVLFPVTPSQRQGIEDLRMCRFVEDDGKVDYLGTYTAFDGRDARSEMLRGVGISDFEMRELTGSAAAAKGMALFPRRVDGQYVMLGRQDNENIWLLRSDDLYTWEGGEKLIEPKFSWDLCQMGNCGSPIEIAEGWLVITHGVGLVRNYAMGAALLDKDDPSKVLARTPEPILRPSPKERDGYVPNVVYSCGAMVHGRTLLLPYGIADNFAAFASGSVDELLGVMN
ncbi:glycoside hydrolase family 130 protein [Sphingomonas bacterium]|uniref:glycoside hydrolase family 130 protein n=1 Tax=Sphingomonas bacterium TaxID=1895847 RepID=UPI002631FCCE|nr:glycoside hydrolase family 130 protein [Sphingomonas bacterium]MDB5679308.1 glycosidase protein [Sphingomonas bacterium]